jgi:hypothetical protein
MNILEEILIKIIAIIIATIGVIIGGTMSYLIGLLATLIMKEKCTNIAFNIGFIASLLGVIISFFLNYQQMKPLYCNDGLPALLICVSPLFSPFWAGVISGIVGGIIGVFLVLLMGDRLGNWR